MKVEADSSGSFASLTHADLTYSDLDIEQMTEVIPLLIAAIEDHLKDSQSKQFGERLLSITLDHLNKVVRGIVAKSNQAKLSQMSNEAFEMDTTRVLGIVTDYITKLRTFLHAEVQSPRPQPSEILITDQTYTEEQDQLVKTWNTLDRKASGSSSEPEIHYFANA